MAKKRKKIPKPEIVIENSTRIPKASLTKSNVRFDFIDQNWLRSFSDRKFTTFLPSESLYAEHITYIFYTLIPNVSKDWEVGKRGGVWKHCHSVNDDKALRKYNAAIKNIHGIDPEQLNIWQLGINGSVRLICHISPDNEIYPLLVDYHHLGYESVKHNSQDTENYRFCPIETYIK